MNTVSGQRSVVRQAVTAIVLVGAALGLTVHGQQVGNPIPEPVTKNGLRVEIRDVARLPDTRMLRAATEDTSPTSWARVSYVRELPDGRRFANDSRGRLYVFDGSNQPSLYADLQAVFPLGFYRSLQSGFIGFEFHPEFASNGLFYTVHGEKGPGNPGKPDFIPPGYTPEQVTYQTVITEWRAARPAANAFAGTRRELLRTGHIVNSYFHPIGHLEFNPTSRPGSPDYGLLYISGTDFGFSNGGGPHASNPSVTQRLDSIVGAMLRIDPRSPSVTKGARGIGDYTVPATNRFAADGDPNTRGEIYAYGFRNVHRFSWDLMDGTLYGSDIGMSQIEEINIIREGNNYGWMRREGIFDNGVVRGGTLNEVHPLSEAILNGTEKDGFTYPVAMYDHGEGQSITAGFAYRGRVPQLRGKFVFGDIARGRLFAADLAALKAADDGIPRTTAPVEEIQLFVRDASGKEVDVTLRELEEKAMGMMLTRADLQISRSRDGELFITTRQDGMIRTLVPSSSPATR
jgi:hypothetical protein